MRLNASHAVKNRNAMIDGGTRSDLILACCTLLSTMNPPSDASTSPASSGWWDHDISPSIPNMSCESESPKPDTIWTADPMITIFIPVANEPRAGCLLQRSMNAPKTAAQHVMVTPVYTTMWGALQKNSGSFCIWDMASQSPADTVMIEPATARMQTSDVVISCLVMMSFVIL